MEAAAKLREHGIVPSTQLQSFVCMLEDCRCEVPFQRKLFTKHFKKRAHHAMESIAIGRLWDCAVVCSSAFGNGGSSVIEDYRRGGWDVGVLPEVRCLPVVQAKKCPKCDKLFEADNALRNHCKTAHKEAVSRDIIKSFPQVLCQSLGRQTNSKKLFRCNAIGPRSGGMDLSQERTATRTGVSELLLKYSHGQAPLPLALTSVSDRQKGSFASLAEAKERLAMWSLSLVDAWKLWKYPCESETQLYLIASKLTGILMEYANEARIVFRATGSFYSVLWDIGTSGVGEKNKRFNFMECDRQGKRTEERYSQSVRTILLIACRAVLYREKYPGVVVGEGLLTAVNDLLAAANSEREFFLEKVHRVLRIIFFEKSSIAEGFKMLFASVVGACLCVGGSSPERVYIRRGTEVSPYVSGILYFVSCCALLEMRKYSMEEEKEAVEAEVMQAMRQGSKVGITVFIELRTICATVRSEENPLRLFVKCNVHEGCGIFEGVEFSIGSLGNAVKKLQDSVRRTLFETILFGKPLIEDIRTRCTSISDDASCVVPGYWALADTRNQQLVCDCLKWVKENITDVYWTSLFDDKKWIRQVKELIHELVTLIHLTAGAPGRGTEIGSIGIRNTEHRQRGMFFAGAEIILIPTYSKQRNMKRGVVRFISRHLDTETSFLLKCFFLFAHPLYVVSCCRSGVPDVSQSSMRDDLLIGAVSAENVAKVVGSCFGQYGIPFNYSSYRHWQRGYIKMVRKELLLKLINNELNEEDVDERSEAADGIVQAGHSMQVANTVYAQRGPYGMLNIDAEKDRVQGYRKASRQWHIDLGLEEDTNRTGECNERSVMPEGSVTTCGRREGFIRMNDADVARIARSVVSGISGLSSGRVSESGIGRARNGLMCNQQESGEVGDEGATLWREREMGIDNREEQFDPLAALRLYLKKADAVFRSKEQMEGMKAVAERKGDVAIILATGMGKTAIVMGPILFEDGFTLWISPLRALLEETRDRLMRGGISEKKLESIGSTLDKPGNVVLLGPEDVDNEAIVRNLTRLASHGLLARIVFDEAHIPFQACMYRESMGGLKALGALKGRHQNVLLTATAPPGILTDIAGVCGVDYAGMSVIRGDPCRSNLRMTVTKMDTGSNRKFVTRVCAELRACFIRSGAISGLEKSRFLVFCLAVSDLEAYYEDIAKGMFLGDSVKVLKYHSRLSREERKEITERWREGSRGKRTVMLATEGFFTGTDYPYVRAVVFAGGCRSLVEFWQAAGRAGRDGKPADISVVYSPTLCRRFWDDTAGDKRLGDFMKWADNEDLDCRRRLIEDFLGGCRRSMTCSEREHTELCDVCRFNERTERGMSTERASSGVREGDGTVLRSDDEARLSKRRRLEAVEHHAARAALMKSWDKVLKQKCVYCVYEEAKNRWKRAREGEQCTDAVPSLPSHTGTKCFRARMRCLRCTEIGHMAKHCRVISSVECSGETRCRECYIIRVDGRYVHSRAEFGRKGSCNLACITAFVLLCFSDRDLRSILTSMCTEIRGKSGPISFAEYANWVLQDKVGDRAAVFNVMVRLHSLLGLKIFGLRAL